MPHSMEEMLLPKVKKIDDNKADIYYTKMLWKKFHYNI